MTPAQWSVVNRIFHDAADLPAQQRADFVRCKSANDIMVEGAVNDLLFADAQGQSYLSLPAAALPEFQPFLAAVDSEPLLREGNLLCDRFQILRQIGEGGMGQVYEALDQELQVRIAVKVIQPEIASREGMTNRFRHEVRLARSITHPNICRTFDLERGWIDNAGIRRELIFLTMEYLHGETLAAHLARSGPLPLDEALAIAEQIAAGIVAAHAHGVVHRDLKPQNVLLCAPEGTRPERVRAVIMDFGLARVSPSSLGLTASSGSAMHTGAAGTFAYMAPEQIAGGQALPASDIYSFGLILFEMVTGRKAFPSEDLVHELQRRFASDPPSVRSLEPSVPVIWDAAVARCLAQHPEDRFASAGDIVAALRGGAVSSPRPHSSSPPRPTSRHALFFAGTASLVLLIAAVSSFFIGSRYRKAEKTESRLSPGALVYMPPVRNHTRNPRLGEVTQMMRVALAQSARIVVLDEAREADTLQRMVKPLDPAHDDAAAREVAMRNGGRRVILVTLTEEAPLLRLLVSVQQPEASTPTQPRLRVERSWTCCGTDTAATPEIPADLLHIVRDAGDWVRQTAGEANDDIVALNAPIEDLTTINWAALAEYSAAERLQEQGKSNDAVLALTEAVRLDPGFALAYARMGDVLFSVERSSEGLEAYRKALDSEEQRRLTRRERDRLHGQYAADTWDFQAAEYVFRDATMYFDHDFLSWFYRGSALIRLGRLPEAEESLRRASALRPSAPSAPLTLASAMFVAGDQRGAQQVAAQLAASGHPGEALWLQAEDLALQGRWTDADRILAQITDLPASNLSSFAWVQRAHLAADHEQTATARHLLEQGIEADRNSGSSSRLADKQLDLAYLECAASEFPRCFQDLETALRSKRDPKSLRAASEVLSRAARQQPPQAVARQIDRFFAELSGHSPGDLYGVSAEIVRDQLRADRLLNRHDTLHAVPFFRKIAVLDPPAEADFRLARSLGRAAEMEGNATRRRALATEAAQIYGSPANRAYIWYLGNFFPPSVESEAETHLKLAVPGRRVSHQQVAFSVPIHALIH